jgi:hypothetical protein
LLAAGAEQPYDPVSRPERSMTDKRNVSILAAAAASMTLAGCDLQSIPRPDFIGATHAAHQQADAVTDRAEDRMPGVSDAVKAPLRDLNLTLDNVPLILVRAYAKPYDMTGLTSCAAILDQVSALDLALGPDVDIPRAGTPQEDMFDKGRGLAGDAALDAVRSATTGVIPVRGWVRRLSGANRAEQEAKAIVLAGSVRRGFLKALGVQQSCEWPAAPLDLQKAALKARALNQAEKTAIGDVPKATVAAGTGAPALNQR